MADLGSDATAGAVVQRAIALSVIRLILHDPVVRIDVDPEGVHQTRVATRRLRSDLRTFRPLLDRDWVQGLRDELGWIARILGVSSANVVPVASDPTAAGEGAGADVVVVMGADKAQV